MRALLEMQPTGLEGPLYLVQFWGLEAVHDLAWELPIHWQLLPVKWQLPEDATDAALPVLELGRMPE